MYCKTYNSLSINYKSNCFVFTENPTIKNEKTNYKKKMYRISMQYKPQVTIRIRAKSHLPYLKK